MDRCMKSCFCLFSRRAIVINSYNSTVLPAIYIERCKSQTKQLNRTPSTAPGVRPVQRLQSIIISTKERGFVGLNMSLGCRARAGESGLLSLYFWVRGTATEFLGECFNMMVKKQRREETVIYGLQQ
ncbi:hypothetical protein VFPPC_09925 [Pochonia chlamydosporia 170]|uniref:Uncharacterized protein n=1 Tax=Pochonia chlamydosporia 170 TaxID=1380566 RepID=A0A179F314_METCM|nr:hypothetical protein VFPPC_09925 [Pochonia chlamydosporia 170]OAQ59814.1 hypothetical protein VFPPC_09925 [Pochonia chlamydosporia 170]